MFPRWIHLTTQESESWVSIYTPTNTETICIQFLGQRVGLFEYACGISPRDRMTIIVFGFELNHEVILIMLALPLFCLDSLSAILCLYKAPTIETFLHLFSDFIHFA